MDGLNKLGERLKDLRTQRELTMDMVVYDMKQQYGIDITKGNLSRWENGINYPSLINAAYLAKYYNVSLDYLIGNTDVKTPVALLTRKITIKVPAKATTTKVKARKKLRKQLPKSPAVLQTPSLHTQSTHAPKLEAHHITTKDGYEVDIYSIPTKKGNHYGNEAIKEQIEDIKWQMRESSRQEHTKQEQPK